LKPLKKNISPETSVQSEFSCYVSEPSKKRVPNVWIGASCASCHMTCFDEGMFNCGVIKYSVKIGNGKELSATKIGDKRMTVVQKYETTSDILLKDCKYVPQLYTNLFSISKDLQKGWTISNHGNSGNLVKFLV
jgi:hypothetical protein